MASSYVFCCCCCLTSWIMRTILMILALLSLALIFFFIIVNPHKMKVHVTEASLTQFDLIEGNKTMIFKLEFNLSIRNPNRIIGFYYDDFTYTSAHHQDEYIKNWDIRPFYQDRKNTTTMRFEVVDKQKLFLIQVYGKTPIFNKARFDEQKRARVFDIDVTSNFYVRVKIGRVRIGKFWPNVNCGLKVPLITTAKRKSGVTGFNVTKCDVEFDLTSIFILP